MAHYRTIDATTRKGMRFNGYAVEVLYHWTDEPYTSHGLQQSFYSTDSIIRSETTIRERLASVQARVIAGRDMATGRFIRVA